MTIRDFLFGTGKTSRATDIGLLILRVGIGLPMAFGHGLGKIPPSEGFIGATGDMGFPIPIVFAWAAALSEFLGGLLIALGLLTRPAALMLAITMAVAAFVRHAADPFSTKELALVYLAASLALLATGAGRYAIDRALRRRD
ncbi:DoxX family protein [Rubrivirga sp.]|uniref:DoxX family protein n=1 Tax=Rubrivirga sp. TaxID=1885344 RepID=UPI003C7663FA